jgi:hypothetical protein
MKNVLTYGLTLLALNVVLCACPKKDFDDPTIKPIKTFTGQMQCLWDESQQANPKCFLDLDNGKVYDVSTAKAHAAEIDLIWTECSGGILICSPTELINYPAFTPSASSSPNFQVPVLLGNWPVTNPTRIDYESSHLVSDFTAITDEPNLLALVGNHFDASTIQWSTMEANSNSFGKVYFVETSTNGVKKKGFIHFTSGQTGVGNFVNFEIKIQQ